MWSVLLLIMRISVGSGNALWPTIIGQFSVVGMLRVGGWVELLSFPWRSYMRIVPLNPLNAWATTKLEGQIINFQLMLEILLSQDVQVRLQCIFSPLGLSKISNLLFLYPWESWDWSAQNANQVRGMLESCASCKIFPYNFLPTNECILCLPQMKILDELLCLQCI